eukprot:m.151963 g.151963  ORF g.151963 m.151963 type:complete len:310 (+) comp10159_c2_seq3:3097-4026(+)
MPFSGGDVRRAPASPPPTERPVRPECLWYPNTPETAHVLLLPFRLQGEGSVGERLHKQQAQNGWYLCRIARSPGRCRRLRRRRRGSLHRLGRRCWATCFCLLWTHRPDLPSRHSGRCDAHLPHVRLQAPHGNERFDYVVSPVARGRRLCLEACQQHRLLHDSRKQTLPGSLQLRGQPPWLCLRLPCSARALLKVWHPEAAVNLGWPGRHSLRRAAHVRRTKLRACHQTLDRGTGMCYRPHFPRAEAHHCLDNDGQWQVLPPRWRQLPPHRRRDGLYRSLLFRSLPVLMVRRCAPRRQLLVPLAWPAARH